MDERDNRVGRVTALPAVLIVNVVVLAFVAMYVISLQREVELCRGLAPAIAEMVETRTRTMAELTAFEAQVHELMERDPGEWRLVDLLAVEASARDTREGM